jgi:Zn-dependent protease with chaperone function
MLASSLINIPFEAYDTFVIEEKFGFNRTTVKTFIADHIKSWILGGITGGGILALVVWFWTLTGPSFWLWAWGLITLFSLFITMFYSTLIVPLFNKQRPLEEGSLRNAIESFTQKAGFRLDSIYVIDSSRRSTKSNAYFSGLGRKKRVVLFDTLIDEMSEEEIVAILAHEVGHYKKKAYLERAAGRYGTDRTHAFPPFPADQRAGNSRGTGYGTTRIPYRIAGIRPAVQSGIHPAGYCYEPVFPEKRISGRCLCPGTI